MFFPFLALKYMIRIRNFFPILILSLFIGSVGAGIFGILKVNQLYKVSNSLSTDPPVADFSFVQTDDCGSSPVKFTDLSTGADLIYSWDFGDGTTSTLASPEHAFTAAVGNGTESFEVRLTVTDTLGVSDFKTSTITVKQVPSTTVVSDRSNTNFDNLPFFIVCDNDKSAFTFYNTSTTKQTNISYTIEWGDGSAPFEATDWDEVQHAYDIGVYYLDYTVKGANGCSVTKRIGVFIGSNPAVGFGNPGNTNICSGEALTFPITGTANNPPGTIYTVTFSDGTAPQVFSHPPPAFVSHVFTETSCGKFGAPGFGNSYSATILAENPCSKSSAQVVPIYITEKPEPIIGLADSVFCQDTFFDIRNETLFGNEVSNNGQCTNVGRFVWEISPATGWELSAGNTLGSRPNPNVPNTWQVGSQVLTPKFIVPGVYTIKLISGNRCGIEEVTETICIIPTPAPAFDLDVAEGCGPIQVKATNTSNLLGTCADGGDYFRWSVGYLGGNCGSNAAWSFAEGSSASSYNPEFVFTNPGKYLITQSLITSCGTFTASDTVSVFAPPQVNLPTIPASHCGSLSLNPNPQILNLCGETSASYLWTIEGGTITSSTDLDPGIIEFNTVGPKKITLAVTTTCGTTIASRDFEIFPIPELEVSEDISICRGESIPLTVTALPAGTYTYQWRSEPASPIQNANTSTPIVSPSQDTRFEVLVRNATTGCSQIAEVFVSVSPAPEVAFSIPNQVICSGDTSVPVQLSSTPPGLGISWTSLANGVSGVIPSGGDLIPSQTLINTGNVPVDVVFSASILPDDLGACEKVVARYIITVNPAPIYADGIIEVCSGSAFDFRPSGVVQGTSFTWQASPVEDVTGIASNDTPAGSVSQTLVNNSSLVKEVVYTIVPILGNCPGTPFSLTVALQPAPDIQFSLPNQTLCTGTASEPVFISSNVAGATFTWTSRANGVLGVIPNGTGSSIPAMDLINPSSIPVQVDIEVRAQTGNQGSCAGVPTVYSIVVNPSISLSSEVKNANGFGITCQGADNGLIKLDPRGGNGIFSYAWTGPNGFISQLGEIENLAPGDYNVTISDDFGCQITASYTISEPPALVVDFGGKQDVLCAGDLSGSISFTARGGIESIPYSISWTKDGNTFQSNGLSLQNLGAGVYQMTLSDANGCSFDSGPIAITEPAQRLAITIEKGDISCYEAKDGFINLNIVGGVAPYQVQWDFGSNQTNFTSLGPGNYAVTVTDQIGCVVSQAVSIIDAPVFKINPTTKNISCFGQNDGQIKLEIEGGNEGLLIRWDDGRQVPEIFNLGPGTYGVTVSKFGTCAIRREFTILEPESISISAVVNDALDCDSGTSGSILLQVSGGVPPYTFAWSNGATSQNLTNITTGTYAVNIADANGCTSVREFVIKRPPPIEVLATRNQLIDCSPRKVQEEFLLTVTGGVPPYTIQWSGGVVFQNGTQMVADNPGLYLVTVRDQAGCEFKTSYEVTNTNVTLNADIESVSFDQNGGFLVGIEIAFINKTIGDVVSYYWDFGDGNSSSETNPRHTYQSGGEYEITLQAIDKFGCLLDWKKKIKVVDYFLVVPNVFTPNGDGVNDYFFPKFVNIESLEFWVLNKWGESLFYTTDLNSPGWDGKIGGDPAMPGNYVYKLRFKTVDGRVETKTEVFFLLK